MRPERYRGKAGDDCAVYRADPGACLRAHCGEPSRAKMCRSPPAPRRTRAERRAPRG